MSAPLNLDDVQPTPVEGIPNYRATSGERGNGNGSKRPGIFGAGRKSPVRSPKPKRESPPKLEAHVKDKLEEFYTFIGLSMMPFDPVTAEIVMTQAKPCAHTVYDLAQENDVVRRVVLTFVTTSTISAVVAAHLPILMTLSARHSRNDKLRDMGIAGMAMMYGKDVVPESPEAAYSPDSYREKPADASA